MRLIKCSQDLWPINLDCPENINDYEMWKSTCLLVDMPKMHIYKETSGFALCLNPKISKWSNANMWIILPVARSKVEAWLTRQYAGKCR